MRHTLYSLNDWLEGEEDLEVTRREQYRDLYGEKAPVDRRTLRRMNTDQLQNFVVILIVMFFVLVLFGWRR